MVSLRGQSSHTFPHRAKFEISDFPSDFLKLVYIAQQSQLIALATHRRTASQSVLEHYFPRFVSNRPARGATM